MEQVQGCRGLVFAQQPRGSEEAPPRRRPVPRLLGMERCRVSDGEAAWAVGGQACLCPCFAPAAELVKPVPARGCPVIACEASAAAPDQPETRAGRGYLEVQPGRAVRPGSGGGSACPLRRTRQGFLLMESEVVWPGTPCAPSKSHTIKHEEPGPRVGGIHPNGHPADWQQSLLSKLEVAPGIPGSGLSPASHRVAQEGLSPARTSRGSSFVKWGHCARSTDGRRTSELTV